MAWIVLAVAGLFEVLWAAAMKQSQGFSRPGPSMLTCAAMLVSFSLLSWSMRTLPLGTAYSVWTGIGTIGAFLVGIVFLGEAFTPMRSIAALFIVIGIMLMKLSAES